MRFTCKFSLYFPTHYVTSCHQAGYDYKNVYFFRVYVKAHPSWKNPVTTSSRRRTTLAPLSNTQRLSSSVHLCLRKIALLCSLTEPPLTFIRFVYMSHSTPVTIDTSYVSHVTWSHWKCHSRCVTVHRLIWINVVDSCRSLSDAGTSNVTSYVMI